MAVPALIASSTAVGVAGAFNQANSQAAASNYNATIAQQNADAANQQASEDARRQQIRAGMQLGSMRAGYGASGVQSSEGSALEVLQNSAAQSELDRLTILNAGERKSAAYTNESTLDKFQAKNAKTAGWLNATGTLLSGGTKAAALGASGAGGGAS